MGTFLQKGFGVVMRNAMPERRGERKVQYRIASYINTRREQSSLRLGTKGNATAPHCSLRVSLRWAATMNGGICGGPDLAQVYELPYLHYEKDIRTRSLTNYIQISTGQCCFQLAVFNWIGSLRWSHPLDSHTCTLSIINIFM
jgi:hypothetical protein